MALSGLGPALAGGYANVYRYLLQRKLEQEDLERRRQEAVADREAQYQNQIRMHMWLEQQQARERERLAPIQEKERKQAAALERMKWWQTFPAAQLRGTPELMKRFLEDYEAAYGAPYPTSPEAVTRPEAIPFHSRQGLEGGLTRFLTPTGTQTIRVPTGEVVQRPILPEKPRIRTLAEVQPGFFGPGAPGAQYGSYPAPTLETGEPDAAEISKLVKTVQGTLPETAQGVRTRVQEEVQTILNEMRQSVSNGVVQGAVAQAQAYNTRLAEAKKAGVYLPFAPVDVRAVEQDARRRHQQLTRGGAGGATETLASNKLALTRKYLSGVPLTPREERILFGTTGEEIVPVKDRAILKLVKDNINPVTGDPIDPNLAERLKPEVDRIVRQMLGQDAAGGTGTTDNDPLGIRVPGTPVGGAVRKPVATTVGPSGPLTTAQINQIVDQAASRGAPFPLAQLRAAGVSESIISLLRQRYQTMRR